MVAGWIVVTNNKNEDRGRRTWNDFVALARPVKILNAERLISPSKKNELLVLLLLLLLLPLVATSGRLGSFVLVEVTWHRISNTAL